MHLANIKQKKTKKKKKGMDKTASAQQEFM